MTNHIDYLRTRSRTVACIATAGAAAALLAACGGTSSPGSLSLPTLPAGLGETTSGAAGPTSGNLGDTLAMMDSGDDVAHVTVLKIVDPAVVDDTAGSPPDGTRWVGVEGTIVIDGARSGQDSTEVEAIGSDGQTYGADSAYALYSFAGCTPTEPGDGLPSGTTQTFCSGVGLPPGVTVVKIGYSTEGVAGADIPAKLFWTVADSGAAAPTPTPESTPTATPGSTPTASPAASTNATGHVGDTLTISGPSVDTVTVTLVKVFYPATGTTDSPPDGTHWVGFELTLSTPDGTASEESQAVDVVGSDGQTYGLSTSYHLGAFTGCTPVVNTTEGQPSTFCAGVGLPSGVTVAQVGYSEAGVDIGAAAEVSWTVP